MTRVPGRSKELPYGGRRKRTICGYCAATRGSTHDQFNETESALALGMLKYGRRHMLNSNVGENILTHKLSRADYVMRKRQKKKQRMRKRTKSSRNPS